MPIPLLGLKLACAIAGGIGAGLAIVHHWDDIKTIAENFDELKAELIDSIKEKQRRKVAVGSDQPHAIDIDDYDYDLARYDDSDGDSDATTRNNLRRRNPRLTVNTSSSSSSQLSMPSRHDYPAYSVPSATDSGSELQSEGLSDYSVIPSDAEWSDNGPTWSDSDGGHILDKE